MAVVHRRTGFPAMEASLPDARNAPGAREKLVRDLLARLQPRPGDILLFYGPERWRGRLIRWYTRSPFYHVGIYAGNGEVIEARLPHVVCRNLTQRDGCQFVVIRAPSRDAGARALAWARQRVGEPYDLWAVAALVLTRVLPFGVSLWRRLCRKQSHVCGAFVARAFSEGAGVELLAERNGVLLVPGDFAILLPEAERKPRGIPAGGVGASMHMRV